MVLKPSKFLVQQGLQRLYDLKIGDVMLVEVFYLLNCLDLFKLLISNGFEVLSQSCSCCHVLLVNLPVEAELELLHDVVPKCLFVTCSCLCIVVCVLLSLLFVVI